MGDNGWTKWWIAHPFTDARTDAPGSVPIHGQTPSPLGHVDASLPGRGMRTGIEAPERGRARAGAVSQLIRAIGAAVTRLRFVDLSSSGPGRAGCFPSSASAAPSPSPFLFVATCGRCEGYGIITDCDIDGEDCADELHGDDVRPCPECDGTGQVPEPE